MSVAREAAGSWTTSPGPSDRSSAVIVRLEEEVAAEEIAGVRSLHVRPRVHDHVPVPACRRIFLEERRPDVGLPLAVRDDLVQGELDRAARLAAAHVNVRNV